MIKNIFLSLTIALIVGFMGGCNGTTNAVSYKSPCVSANGGPCDRYSVNDWWLKGEATPRLVRAFV